MLVQADGEGNGPDPRGGRPVICLDLERHRRRIRKAAYKERFRLWYLRGAASPRRRREIDQELAELEECLRELNS